MTSVAGPGTADTDTFSMDSTSGQIYLAKALDFETVETYEIVVTVQDKGGLEVGDRLLMPRIRKLTWYVMSAGPVLLN